MEWVLYLRRAFDWRRGLTQRARIIQHDQLIKYMLDNAARCHVCVYGFVARPLDARPVVPAQPPYHIVCRPRLVSRASSRPRPAPAASELHNRPRPQSQPPNNSPDRPLTLPGRPPRPGPGKVIDEAVRPGHQQQQPIRPSGRRVVGRPPDIRRRDERALLVDEAVDDQPPPVAPPQPSQLRRDRARPRVAVAALFAPPARPQDAHRGGRPRRQQRVGGLQAGGDAGAAGDDDGGGDVGVQRALDARAAQLDAGAGRQAVQVARQLAAGLAADQQAQVTIVGVVGRGRQRRVGAGDLQLRLLDLDGPHGARRGVVAASGGGGGPQRVDGAGGRDGVLGHERVGREGAVVETGRRRWRAGQRNSRGGGGRDGDGSSSSSSSSQTTPRSGGGVCRGGAGARRQGRERATCDVQEAESMHGEVEAER